MMLDVSDLLRRNVKSKKVSFSIPQNSMFADNTDLSCNKPAELEGAISVTEDILTLVGKLRTELVIQCSRCIEEFIYPVDIDVHEEFSNKIQNKDDNIIFIDSDNIDITEVMENSILVVLPIKNLCSIDCKGLCQRCGMNLNQASCECHKDDVDPRLAKLKDMFSTD
jgi:uncharacterized protein